MVLKENSNMTGYDILAPAFPPFSCHMDQGIFIILSAPQNSQNCFY